ncbi:MAG TPA: Crp/Fnr family transcriptional regulator [Spirochaetia bacterium]|nr:Crp/Fnr family transcriptional regulator [Spirochaetia bacterium]
MIGSAEMIDAFPFMGEMEERQLARVVASIIPKSLDHGQYLARDGAECSYLPFVLSGTLRIYKLGEQGKELTLYRVERGESCILTATCILNSSEFPAIAQAEGSAKVALLPAPLFAALVDETPQWRRYLFGLYSQRLEMVIAVIEEIAFHHVDARVAGRLLGSSSAGSVRTTHQQLASEIGTSREVVSRVLKDLETDGVIGMSRGMIEIIDRSALQRKSEN